jgi:hypothetical protein
MTAAASNLKERVRHELRQYALTALYLWVWLAALLLYRSALLREEGLAAVPLGLAAAKALILGKFVLLGEAAGAGTRLGARTLTHRIAYRSLSLLVVLFALNAVEELVRGWIHGRVAADSLAELLSLEHAAGAALMLLVLVPFVTAKQVSLALGPGVLRRLLLGSEARAGAGGRES